MKSVHRSALLFFCILAVANSAVAFTETERLASWAKVWGFLKYYHPEVAKGARDWDQQMIGLLPEVRKAATPEKLSGIYQKLLTELGPVPACEKCVSETEIPSWYRRNLDLSFLTDSTVFTPQLQKDLLFIKQNRNQKPNYYAKHKLSGEADFSNEKGYEEMLVPSEEYRLLTLFRYWNAINYFFPYKYAIDEDWKAVLERLIPVFRKANDFTTYYAALRQMVASIQDSHSTLDIKSPVALKPHKDASSPWYYSAYTLTFVGRKPVVNGFHNDSLASLGPLRLGDIVTQVNHVPVDSIIEQKRKSIPASNEATLLRALRTNLLIGHTQVTDITIERDGKIINEKMQRHTLKDLSSVKEVPAPTVSWVGKGIGYVHMGKLKLTEVDSTMRALRPSKAIIFDLRHYPQETGYRIATYLTGKEAIRTLATSPDFTYPGVFQELAPRIIKPAKGKAYKGKVVLLINEHTQSQGEFTTMLMKASPRAVLVGGHTAGADGNVAYLPLPGGLQAVFTGLGIYYPDRTETQRVGILPDVEVKPTVLGIKEGRDEVLEKALEVVRSKM
jgi:carboxyl-terminal processing protease